MKNLIFFLLLLWSTCAHAQAIEPDWVTRIDLIRSGTSDDAKAIRLTPTADTYELVLVNLPEISLNDVCNTLAKVPCGYLFSQLDDRIVIVPQGLDCKQITDLLSTLVLGDFGHVFFRYVPKELKTAPRRETSRTR